MAAWIVWLIAAAALGLIELLTVTLSFGLIAIGALIAAVAAVAGGNLAIQLGAFAAPSAASLILVRPIALRHLRQPPLLRSGTAALVGKSAVVLEDVGAHGGRVRIGGEVWSARPYDETLLIKSGATVDGMKIEGATALVYPRELP